MFVPANAAHSPETPSKPLGQLADEIATLAANVHAATCRWLVLVAEFDAREGWVGWKSCAHWVSWRCGLSPRSARDHVRVARWLVEKPLIRAAFGRGELSYSKVRALSKTEGVVREDELLTLALTATAAQLDRIVRGYCRVLALDSTRVHARRYLHMSTDEDGSVVLRGRLPAEDAAVLQKALDIARAELVERNPHEERVDSHAADTVDALTQLAESFLAADAPAERGGGERFQVVLHVDADSLAGDEAAARCETEDGNPISAETARRISCDASLVTMVERRGRPVSVGRKTRKIPAALQRALRSRDGGCRFPGCTAHHRVDAHHIRHWARGGRTDLENLVQLCRYHHRLIHEGGFGLERRGDSLVFTTPRGYPIPASPRLRGESCGVLGRDNRRSGVDPGPDTTLSGSMGDRYDLHMAVDAVWSWRAPPDRSMAEA